MSPSLARLLLTLYPPFLFQRIRPVIVEKGFYFIRMRAKQSILNRNLVGTIFGGTIFSMTDPVYMLMLWQILGFKKYIIWDKEAHIEYIRPGRKLIYADFRISEDDLHAIKKELNDKGKALPEFTVSVLDKNKNLCAVVRKIVYIRKK